MRNILEIKNLVVSYGGIEAVKGIDLKVEEGKIVTLIGSNGAGKSTTLKAVAGLVKPKSGEILLNGANLVGKSTDQIVSSGVTLPLLIPAIASAVIINLIGSLKLNDIIISLTNGGPAQQTHSLSTYISYVYFRIEKAGYASAIGVFMFVFILIVTIIANRYFRSKEVEY